MYVHDVSDIFIDFMKMVRWCLLEIKSDFAHLLRAAELFGSRRSQIALSDRVLVRGNHGQLGILQAMGVSFPRHLVS